MKRFVKQFRRVVEGGSTRCGRLRAIAAFAVGAAALFLSGCAGRAEHHEAGEAPLSVAATIPPLEFFARAIGGDSVAVTTLLKPGSDPETFEPGVGAMRALGSSEIMLSTGLMPFEQNLARKNASRGDSPRLVDVAEGIDLIYGTHGHDEGHEHGHGEAPEAHDGLYADPHIWSSVANARIMAENTLRAFCSADTARTPYYTANYRALMSRLDTLEAAWTARLAPLHGRSFAIRHPSLSYFARDFGMRQLPVTDGQKESSAGGRAKVLAGIRGAAPLVYFVEQGSDRARTAMTADALGLTPVEINPMSADWETEMARTVGALAGAAPAR